MKVLIMSTISDVAQLAGVSTVTVSRVLNDSAPVKRETRLRIMEAIEQLSYVPNINARGMRTKATGLFGVIFPEYMNPFGYEVMEQIELAASRVGYHCIITTIGAGPDRINHIRKLLNRGVDGIVIYLYGIDPKLGEYLYQLSLEKPVVFMDNYFLEGPINKVSTRVGMDLVIRHLLERGRRKIGIIAVTSPHIRADRLTAYKEALAEASLEIREDYIYEGDYSLQSGYDAGKYFSGMGSEMPDAIVSYTDYMAIGAMNYLQSHGFSIPGDIAVAGYDGISMGKLALPALTTYNQNFSRLGEEIVGIILSQLHHGNHEPREVLCDGELIIRSST